MSKDWRWEALGTEIMQLYPDDTPRRDPGSKKKKPKKKPHSLEAQDLDDIKGMPGGKKLKY